MRKPRFLIFTSILIILTILACSTRQRQFAIAERLQHAGRSAEALSLYEKLLSEIPPNQPRYRSQVYYRIGECLYGLDRLTDSFGAFQKAVEAEPGNLSAHLRLGELFLAGGAPERAKDQAELVMRNAPQNSEAVALWGASLAASGKTGPAEEAYRRALAMDPQRMTVAVALADLYNREDREPDARKVLEESAAANPSRATPLIAMARLSEQEGDILKAEESYRKAIALEDTPDTNLRLAQFLQRNARVEEAEQVLRRVDALQPAQPTALPDFELMAGKAGTALDRYLAALNAAPLRDRRKAKASRQTGNAPVQQRAKLATRLIEADIDVADHQKGREKTEALQHARAHLDLYRIDLDQATLAILQAEIALSEADLMTAAVQANTAVSLAPQSAPAHYVMGMVRNREGNVAEARTQWLAALDADAHFVPARLLLAQQALDAGDAKGAEEYVVQVVRDEPGNTRALDVFARVLTAEKRYSAAIVIAQRSQALDSTAPEPHLALGQIAMEQHRLGQALIQFEQAVLLQPHSRDAMEGLTRVYKTGKITRAMLAKMEHVAAAPPPSAALMEIAGRLYADHGWYGDAKRCLEQALHMDPQRTTAAAALAKTYATTGELEAAADSASRTGGKSAALLAGVQAEQRHDVGTAIANYERALRQGERSGVAANNLAWLYAEQGTNLDRALELAEAARSMAPQNPAVLDTVGVVRLRMHKYSEAIQALESANQMAARRQTAPALVAQIRRHLSEAYLRAGKTDAAATAVAR
ncbi:MAG: tetratricopeptide repeat protein [Terriglobales bacterium]